MEVKGFVLEFCPHCRFLYGYDKKDTELRSIFSKDCKIKNIVKRQKFDLDNMDFTNGIVTLEHRRRGSKLRQELQLRLAQPDLMIDIDARRIGKFVTDYGKNIIKNAIFIDRFQIINLTQHKPLMYRYHVKLVPAFMSPYCPYGMMQAVSSKETEKELEKLLFLGNCKIKPSTAVATAVR